MAKENGKKGIVTVSVIAFLLFTGVILFLSLSDYFGGDNDASLSRKASQLDMSSDATPGENNKEVKFVLLLKMGRREGSQQVGARQVGDHHHGG